MACSLIISLNLNEFNIVLNKFGFVCVSSLMMGPLFLQLCIGLNTKFLWLIKSRVKYLARQIQLDIVGRPNKGTRLRTMIDFLCLLLLTSVFLDVYAFVCWRAVQYSSTLHSSAKFLWNYQTMNFESSELCSVFAYSPYWFAYPDNRSLVDF